MLCCKFMYFSFSFAAHFLHISCICCPIYISCACSLQLKQSCIPVFNLTTNLSPEFEFPVDPRSKTVQAAAIHARMQHFMVSTAALMCIVDLVSLANGVSELVCLFDAMS